MKHITQIHAQIIVKGLFEETLTVGKLIAFCAISLVGGLSYARLIFNQVTEPNLFMWNSLIRGYSNSDSPKEALLQYHQMLGTGRLPNDFTFPFVLKACAFELALAETLAIHVQVIKLGFVSQVYVQNALLHVYAVCGTIDFSRKVFDDIIDKNTVSWNSMIGGYSQMGLCPQALQLFGRMRDSGLYPDEFTFVNLLTVCSQTGNIELGRILHLYIETTGVRTDLFVKNALLDMYAKCGYLATAKMLFDKMPDKNVVTWTSMFSAYANHGLFDLSRQHFDEMAERNVVSWNSMISCYAQHGLCREALDLYAQMQLSTEKPDEVTLVNVLAACSQIGDLVMDMYTKCGSLTIALDLFNQIPIKNVVLWNVMIGAFAMHGLAQDAIDLFEMMKDTGLCPDGITFVGILTACSHGGFLHKGRYYFEAMNPDYGVPHEIEHYACMVDLLGRAGHLQEAVLVIGTMPMKPDAVVWGALLGACRIHGNIEITVQILKQLLELVPYNGGLFVLVSNIFCDMKRWEDVKRVRILMKEKGIRKANALSLIEIDGNIHAFLVEDIRHELSSSIYSMLDGLTHHMRSVGYFLSPSRAFLNE
ncbi:pentatricopeptide repeat-containing protein At2g22410, mitochondrial-like [Aristolochia californica]|uniref:pentatricopeptide repeat-containing protein At2g22410, mitochondrial-like n=1 Tax=Aristolochia californica TaxID=171875 RepID=UPI0035E28410